MNDKLEKRLYDTFKFYRPELSETVSLMCYGFSHGDGWFDIIWELSEKIQSYLEEWMEPDELAKSFLTENPPINVSQVKEKFGALRYYVDTGDIPQDVEDKIERAIRDAERKTATTCEECGKPEKFVEAAGFVSNAQNVIMEKKQTC